jgi:hypothetical protein
MTSVRSRRSTNTFFSFFPGVNRAFDVHPIHIPNIPAPTLITLLAWEEDLIEVHHVPVVP